jgi:hypothetical protein
MHSHMFNNEGNAVHKFTVPLPPSVSLYEDFSEATVCYLMS